MEVSTADKNRMGTEEGDISESESFSLPPEKKIGRQEYIILGTLCLVCFLASVDSTIFLPVLPALSKDLGADAISTLWVGSGYLLPCAAFQPFMSSLSDIYGRQPLLFSALIFFTAGSIVGATATNISSLLAGRVIQGIGGGGLISLNIVVMTDIFPLRQRPKYTSFIQLATALGTVIGPVIGGLFIEHGGWRWVFYINFPFCALAFPAVVFGMRPLRRTHSEGSREVDWFGGCLFTGSVLSFLIAISWGGVQYPWSNFRVWLPLCVGVGGVVGTAAWEKWWWTETPFLRLSLLCKGSASAVFLGTLIQGILLFGTIYYTSLYLQTVKSLSPTLSGVAMLSIFVPLMPTSTFVALLISRLGRYRWALWSGWTVTVLSTGLLCLLDVDTSTGSWIGIFIIVGLGHGLLFNSLLFAAQALSSEKDVAYAAALYMFTRTVGTAVGVIVGGTVLQNMMAAEFERRNFSADEYQIVGDAVGYIRTLGTLSDNEWRAVVSVYSFALRGVFAVLTGVGGLGLIASLFVPHRSLDRPLESRHKVVSNPKEGNAG